MKIISFLDLLSSLESKHESLPEVFLSREVIDHQISDGHSVWKIRIGLPGMPKITIVGDSHNDVIEKTAVMYGIDPYVLAPIFVTSAPSMDVPPAATKTRMQNKRGDPILLGQVWKDCDKRRPDRFGVVAGYDQWHVQLLPCDRSGNILGKKMISINPLRMQTGSTGWRKIS